MSTIQRFFQIMRSTQYGSTSDQRENFLSFCSMVPPYSTTTVKMAVAVSPDLPKR